MIKILMLHIKISNCNSIVEKAVENLTTDQYMRFRDWFENYEAMKWDKEIEDDINSGRLKKYARNATEDFKSDDCIEL